MIVEIFQLIRMLMGEAFYYLPIHLILFVLLPLILRKIKAQRYRSFSSLNRRSVRVSVVVPEYNEEIEIFEKCLKSIVENGPDEIIVVHDDAREEIRILSEKYGAKVCSFPHRVGKRAALVKGWELASGDIVVQVDSDVILGQNAINEIIKPFDDSRVVGVQGKNLVYNTGSWLAYRMSQIIEANRDLNNKALNGHLVVIDGRFNAWRREWLLKQREAFLNEYFLGCRCELGDDRLLTQRANLQGYKTCYQDTAVAFSAAPQSYIRFIKQQLRWARSGYKAFFMDIKLGLSWRAPLAYNIFQFCYYLGPLSFTLSIIHDVLFTTPILAIIPWLVLPIAIIGSGLIALIRRIAVGIYKITIREFFLIGFTSLFISYPLMLYALATMREQQRWLTR